MRPRILRRAILAATLLHVGLASTLAPAAAQEPAPPTEFLIERIVVEGLERETARRIVLSESLLHEGRTYTEPALRDAIYRVKRLSFVLDADMALRKGSERGAYELVISVEPVKPVAFSVEAGGFSYSEVDGFEGSGLGTVSARKFVGARGLLFASVEGFDDLDFGQVVQAGYTRYGLFGGTGGYATVALASRVGGEGDYETLQSSLDLGIPLVGNHALEGGFTWFRSEQTFADFPGAPLESREDVYAGALFWTYDRTDDPLVTTEGLRFRLGGEYSESRSRYVLPPGVEDEFFTPFDNEHLFLRAEGRNYWRLTPRQSVAAGAYLWNNQSEFRSGKNDELLVAGEFVHAVSLWGPARSQRLGDFRLESSVTLSQFHERETAVFDVQDSTDLYLQTSLLFRNAWGVVRLSVSYAEQLGGGA